MNRTIDLEVLINASPSTVFEALSTRAGLDAWWGTALNAEPQAGAVVTFDHGFGQPLEFRIVELDPDVRLVWECISDISDHDLPACQWHGHRLSFDLCCRVAVTAARRADPSLPPRQRSWAGHGAAFRGPRLVRR